MGILGFGRALLVTLLVLVIICQEFKLILNIAIDCTSEKHSLQRDSRP